MKNYAFFFLALVTLIFSSCDDDCFRGSNNIVQETRTIDSEISTIEARGSFDIRVFESDLEIIELRGNENVLDLVRTDIIGDRLVLDLIGTCFNNYTLDIDIYTQNFSSVILTGSGDALIEGLDSQTSLNVEMSGSGDVVLDGNVDLLSVQSSGSGDLEAFNLQANTISLTKSGSGDSEVRAVDLVIGTMSGSGDLFYKGNPELSINLSGSGEIIDAN